MAKTHQTNIVLSGMLAITLLLASCSDDSALRATESGSAEDSNAVSSQVTQVQETTSTTDSHDHEVDFTPNYIAADDLNDLLGSDAVPYIFDVRSNTSFEVSHIKTSLNMPYGQTTDELLSAVTGLNKYSEIVTYCGCPRHLSSLSAKDLTDSGYENVKVLYEGYWHWKDSGYPVAGSEETASLTHLKFEGSLTQSETPSMGVDVFLKHPGSGQMEAARTNKEGQFSFDFHLYNYDATDLFEVILSNIHSAPVQLASAQLNTINRIEVAF